MAGRPHEADNLPWLIKGLIGARELSQQGWTVIANVVQWRPSLGDSTGQMMCPYTFSLHCLGLPSRLASSLYDIRLLVHTQEFQPVLILSEI